MTPVQLLNLALLKIGQSKGITTVNDASREAWTGALVFDHILRGTLQQFPMGFSTRYGTLTLTQGPSWTSAPVQAWSASDTYAIGDVVTDASVVYYAILAGINHQPPNATYWDTTATEEANGDWLYAYRWPTDCLFVRRVVPPGGNGRTFSDTPIPYRKGRDSNGLLVYTNEQDAVIEYTTIDCDNLWADDLWIDAFTWRLAGYLAPSLSRDPKMGERCYTMAAIAFDLACANGSKEQQQDKPGEADWIRGR